jgi:hypothetical protein
MEGGVCRCLWCYFQHEGRKGKKIYIYIYIYSIKYRIMRTARDVWFALFDSLLQISLVVSVTEYLISGKKKKNMWEYRKWFHSFNTEKRRNKIPILGCKSETNRTCYMRSRHTILSKVQTRLYAQNYWVPSPGILNIRKQNVSETGYVSVLRWREEDTYSVVSFSKC